MTKKATAASAVKVRILCDGVFIADDVRKGIDEEATVTAAVADALVKHGLAKRV